GIRVFHVTGVQTCALPISLGVATERCVKDYFRLRNPLARRAMRVLLERGELEPVTVTGWQRPAYLWSGSRVPRRVSARALLSPLARESGVEGQSRDH